VDVYSRFFASFAFLHIIIPSPVPRPLFSTSHLVLFRDYVSSCSVSVSVLATLLEPVCLYHTMPLVIILSYLLFLLNSTDCDSVLYNGLWALICIRRSWFVCVICLIEIFVLRRGAVPKDEMQICYQKTMLASEWVNPVVHHGEGSLWFRIDNPHRDTESWCSVLKAMKVRSNRMDAHHVAAFCSFVRRSESCMWS
jgi:hypothetical protein